MKRKPTVLQNFDDDMMSEVEVPLKYNIGEEIWVKLDSNSKWMPGKIEQVLPNQSYTIKMVDGQIFRRNEHHITIRRPGVKWPRVSTPVPQQQQQRSYNLRQKKKIKALYYC